MTKYFNPFFCLIVSFGITCCSRSLTTYGTTYKISSDTGALLRDNCFGQSAYDIIGSKLSTKQIRRFNNYVQLFPEVVLDSLCIGLYHCKLATVTREHSVHAFVLFGKNEEMTIQTPSKRKNKRNLTEYLRGYSIYFTENQIIEIEKQFCEKLPYKSSNVIKTLD